MSAIKSWMTEYDAEDGGYCGPIIRADSRDFAEAIAREMLLGPAGQTLRVVGEIVAQIAVDDHTTRSTVRRDP